MSLHDRRAVSGESRTTPTRWGSHPAIAAHGGHSFNDVQRRHRTLYCAATQETALREVLADLRPNAEVIAKHLELYGAEAASSLPKAAITEKWRQDNVLMSCTLVYEGRLLDLTDTHQRQEIETRHAQLLADHGMFHLDMHEITTRRRIVTQTIATDAYNSLDVAAIVFASSRDGQACTAIFEGRAELERTDPPIALTDPPPQSLATVATDWKLGLSSAAPATR